jgi:DNA polymerase V
MGQIAAADEELLYRMFGIDAELIIDHAWGQEPVTIADIKAYKPKSGCLSSGQVLMRDYTVDEGRLILREMADELCLDMTRKGLVTSSMTFSAGYSKTQADSYSEGRYTGAGWTYKNAGFAHGTARVPVPTSSADVLVPELLELYDRIMDRKKMIRRFQVSCNDVTEDNGEEQLTLFGSANISNSISSENMLNGTDESKAIQQTMVDIKERFGKNAIFKSSDLKDEATALERNKQIGGHKSGE